jgi:VRR-NUC domain
MSEKNLQSQILLALSEAGCTVWRQNTGLAWVGDAIQLANGDVLLKNPRRLHVGLCKGSSDIVGIHPDGRFLAPEVKTPIGRATKEQLNFIRMVNEKGGVAGVVRSVDEALKLIS